MLIYAGIAAFGLLLLLVLLFVGEVFGGDQDLAHDGGLGDHDASGGPSIFSIRVMAAFLTAFGAGGVIARHYEFSHVAASAVGITCGVVMATIVYQFARMLYAQQASTDLRMSRLVGVTGEVSVAIPPGGVGQITINAAGERSEHIARAADGRSVSRGTAVTITGLGGDSVIVTPSTPPQP
jgi:membrane protein implicated in regulation of membrane protease activity